MGVIVHSQDTGARLYLTLPQWRSLLRIAGLFEWWPTGTILDSEEGWAGGYRLRSTPDEGHFTAVA